MTIRQDLAAQVQAARDVLTAAEAKMSAFEAEASVWLDKEESEVKAFVEHLAEHFGWIPPVPVVNPQQ